MAFDDQRKPNIIYTFAFTLEHPSSGLEILPDSSHKTISGQKDFYHNYLEMLQSTINVGT
ncbi:hypothetical protein [Candidatus Nitrosocosmicus sp. T]